MDEWSRALDVRLSEWCRSVSMVWVQIPSREEQKLTTLKSNSNTVCFNFQMYIYICKYILDFNIRDTCIFIMECSEIERRTIPVEEVISQK